MKYGICIRMCLACLAVLILCVGCAAPDDPVENGSGHTAVLPEGDYVIRHGDWRTYGSAQELIDASALVFAGKVTGIDFRVLDVTDAMPPDEETPDNCRELYTIYQVEVITMYKGTPADTVNMRVMGGMVGYREAEQRAIMLTGQAVYSDRGIPVWDRYEKVQCEIGGSYLFALYQVAAEDPTPLNLDQTVYNLEEPLRPCTLGGRSFYSAYDIVSAFGAEYAEQLMQDAENGRFSAR